jgi:Rrf2 family nitric oxide-sensitive transcriptional repressor
MGGFVESFDEARNQFVVTPVCGLRHALGGAVEAFLRHLDGFTVADLIGDDRRFRMLLDTALEKRRPGIVVRT